MSQVITIRFAQPRPGRGGSSPGLDHVAMRVDLHAQLEPLLKAQLGQDTQLRLEEGANNDIRVEGRFSMKANEVKQVVSQTLGDVMENFDASGYSL
jgi:uncharacterized lipoprotein YajG